MLTQQRQTARVQRFGAAVVGFQPPHVAEDIQGLGLERRVAELLPESQARFLPRPGGRQVASTERENAAGVQGQRLPPGVVELECHRQCLLDEPRRLRIVRTNQDEPEVDQPAGQAAQVADGTRDRDRFLTPAPGGFVVALQPGEVPRARQRFGSVVIARVNGIQRALQPAASLADTALEVPEPAQRAGQAASQRALLVLQQPG